MADEIQAAPEGTPVFQIQRMYLKDLSLEQPNAPHILLEQAQPQVDINLALSAENVTDGIFEVCVTATVNTKVGDRTLFLVEAKQAGIFEIRNVPQDQVEGILGIVCPADGLPLPACHRVGRLHPCRLPARAADGSELPGHVRSPAGPACRPGRQRRQLSRALRPR